ncbi:MAG: sensor histidine kinase [Gemmataceae bacterium]
MRSIRLSLVVYFLLLEAAALGAAAWLVYHTADESLRAEQVERRKAVEAQFKADQEAEVERFDDELTAKARTLADISRPQFHEQRAEMAPFVSIGLVTATITGPDSHCLTPMWVAIASHSAWQDHLRRRLENQIELADELLPRLSDPVSVVYFQVNNEAGVVWRSHSLGEEVLPFDPQETFEKGPTKADNVTLPNGFPGRRVLFKTLVPPRRPRPQDGRAANVLDAPVGDWPWAVFQCVSETKQRDAVLGRLNADTAKKMSALMVEGSDAEERLLKQLGWIGLLTFLSTVFGGSLLVGLGLSPLRRLVDAVSQVSSRDFHLPLDNKPMPRELDPIVTRLRATLEELGRAFHREKQASADISHELRTPVAALLATLDVALRKPRSAEEYRQTLVDARAIGGQMRQLVERILALTKLDAGSTRLQTGTVDISDLVAQCVTLVRPLGVESELTLKGHCPPHLLWYTDGDKLREVLINLLHNAIQYNRPGGSVDLSAKSSDGKLEITVSDTGIGIDEKSLPHLFERFYRADPSRQSSELNAGLGLSIVRGYVELLGGTVTVHSQPGQGTTFRVVLPEQQVDHGREAA